MVTDGKPIFMFSAQEIERTDPTDPTDRTSIKKNFRMGWFFNPRDKAGARWRLKFFVWCFH
jgi:hypothetical protein